MICILNRLLFVSVMTFFFFNANAVELQYGIKLGFREDDLNWNIAGTPTGTDPNVLSELSWSNVRSAQFSGFGKAYFDNRWYLEAEAGYGRVFSGSVQDSDFSGDDRTNEFSRSISDAKKGRLVDGKFAVGYQLGRRDSRSGTSLLFIPLLGYSYSTQNLSMTGGEQIIPPLGPFDGLDSEYDAEWSGPFVGFRTQYDRSRDLGFYLTYEYHEAEYEAQAVWNLRPDFAQDPSFKHSADGVGHIISAGVRFTPVKRWTVSLEGRYQQWHTDPGRDVVFFSLFGLNSSTRLNEVEWNSWSIMVTPMFRF